MKRIARSTRNWFRGYAFEFVFLGVVVVAAVTNFTPDKTLMGWDNIQTDLNPTLGIKRALQAVWQEYQSFGLLAGNAHAADLPRAVFVYFMSLLIPQPHIRYVFHMGMILIGGLGMLRLLAYKGNTGKSAIFAFLGTLFYTFNFGSIQIFYLPFEPFSIFFAGLPWMILLLFKTLTNPTRRTLLITLVAHIVFSAAFYIQTFFVVYVILVACIFVPFLVSNRMSRGLKTVLVLAGVIMSANLYWLLPQAYFFGTSRSVVVAAKINQLATDNVYHLNLEKDDLKSVFMFNSFYTDLYGVDRESLFKVWNRHFSWNIIPYIFILIALMGILRRQDAEDRGITLAFMVTSSIFLSNTPGFAELNDTLRGNGIISQIFRSPFTKFIIPFALCYAYFFASGLRRMSGGIRTRYVVSAAIVLLLLYMRPVFWGHLFSHEMKVSVPRDYADVTNYFKTVDKNARISLLPDYTFWGWFVTRWGYNGSGFMWYGLEQPTVSRTFDVWSRASEQYYWEIKSAAEREDVLAFERVLEKYHIDYMIFDKSLMPVSATLRGIQYDRYKTLFSRGTRFRTVYNGPNLQVLKFERGETRGAAVYAQAPNIGRPTEVMYEDQAYATYGPYITDWRRGFDTYYPFRSFNSQSRVTAQEWKLTENSDNFVMSTPLPASSNGLTQHMPKARIPVNFYERALFQAALATPSATLVGTEATLSIPKQLVYRFIPAETTLYNCSFFGDKNGHDKRTYEVTVTSRDRSSACFGYDGRFLDQNYAYLVKVKSHNQKGRRLFFYTLDDTKHQSVVEARLAADTEYFIIPPRYKHGLGYQFVFQNHSYANLDAVNTLVELDVYLLPFNDIESFNLQIPAPDAAVAAMVSPTDDIVKTSYFSYQVTLAPDTQTSLQYLAFFQAYNSGWRAFVNGQPLTNHVLVNNWANGWELPHSPQE